MLTQILEENLDKNPAAGCRFLLVHMDNRHDVPANRIGADHVAEEPRDVAQSIGLIPMDCVVVFGKSSLEQVGPQTVDLREPFANEPIELRVRSLLRATLDNHGRQFVLETSRQGYFHQLVTAFFKVDTRHDRQIDRSSQIDQVCVALVFDVHLLFFVLVFIGAHV